MKQGDDSAVARLAPSPETQAWFDAAAQGRLLYRWCNACGAGHHPPRSACPHCFSQDTTWRESAGLGHVYSSSLLRRGAARPYCVAYVELDEGVTMLTNLAGFGDETPRVGTRVKVRFATHASGLHVAHFEAA